MNTTDDCFLALFATNEDLKAGKPTSGLRGVPLADIDRAARAFAAKENVPGATIRAYDKDQRQIGLWLYQFPEIIVRIDVR